MGVRRTRGIAVGRTVLTGVRGHRRVVRRILDHVSDDDEIEFTVLVGQAAPDVHGLRVETADERYEHPVHHPPGLVVIAAVGPALVTAPGNEP